MFDVWLAERWRWQTAGFEQGRDERTVYCWRQHRLSRLQYGECARVGHRLEDPVKVSFRDGLLFETELNVQICVRFVLEISGFSIVSKD